MIASSTKNSIVILHFTILAFETQSYACRLKEQAPSRTDRFFTHAVERLDPEPPLDSIVKIRDAAMLTRTRTRKSISKFMERGLFSLTQIPATFYRQSRIFYRHPHHLLRPHLHWRLNSINHSLCDNPLLKTISRKSRNPQNLMLLAILS